MIIYGSDNDYINDISVVGGKGYGLFKLLRYGFRVPDFFVVAAGTDLDDENFKSQLYDFAAKLSCETFSVRSSGVAEDGDYDSFAGQFGTELNVSLKELHAAVRRVAGSVNGKSAAAYGRKNTNFSTAIAVIVQKQINGRESGVLFSTAPQDSSVALIERVSGGGDSLVSGKVVPQTLRYKKSETIGGYEGELIGAAAILEEREGAPVDVEWTYDGVLWLLQLRRQTVISDVIPDVPERNWNLYVYRDFSVFAHSVQAYATDSELQRSVFGFSVPVTEGLLVCGREFYSDENDAKTNEIWSKLDCGNFFEEFLEKIERVVIRTKRRCSAVKRKDFSSLSDGRLLSAYKREIEAYIQSYVPMMMRPDDYLFIKLCNLCGGEKALKSVEEIKALLPPTYYSAERGCFLRAVACGDSGLYLKKYEWKNNPLGKVLLPLKDEEFNKRAVGNLPECAEELLRVNNEKRKGEAKCAREYFADIGGEEARLINLISRFTYYRTRTAENSDRYFYYIRKNLLGEIARRTGLKDETLALYKFDEICSLFKGERLNKRELNKRKSGDVLIFTDGGVKTYFGANSYLLLKKLLPECSVEGAVYGEVACAGEVTGKVKVVSSFADAEDMRDGQILVTSMTTPDITLALEKAAGIITDEGGITCHAAIIAREYAVPCLVGTKVATRILRDGMTVRLDCITGNFQII